MTVEDDDDDEWVTFAYVAAYTGLMIGWGCAVWGSGWYYPPYGYYGGYPDYPYPHTYGMGAWYNPYTGAYGRGYAAYGPYGGVGMGASYNPRTGTYARGAAAYGPYGSRAAGQAYNPRTGTYAQTRQGSNVYGNWGTSSVQRGDNWAQTAHRENYRTGQTTSGIRTERGRRRGVAHRSRWGPDALSPARAAATSTPATTATCIAGPTAADGSRTTDPDGWNSVDRPDADRRDAPRERPASAGTARSASSNATGPPGPRVISVPTSRSSWQSGGATRAGAGSYGGGRGARWRRRWAPALAQSGGYYGGDGSTRGHRMP